MTGPEKNEFADVEEYFKRIVLKPAPPGLRDRVLRSAGSKRRKKQVLSPAVRWQFTGCAVVLAFFLFGDAAVSRKQAETFGTFLDGKGRNGGAVVVDEQRRLLLEEIAVGGDAEDSRVLEMRLVFRGERRDEGGVETRRFTQDFNIWEEDQASYDVEKNPK